MHNAYIGRRSENGIKCVVHDDRVTGFTSDFLSFVVVEHIRFFHRALQNSELMYCLFCCQHEERLFGVGRGDGIITSSLV